MQQPSNVLEFPSTAELSQLLECPVCTEIPLPPISQCVLGHILCQVCRPKVQNCPQCRSVFSTTRCYTIEGIVNNSKFDCKLKKHGCKEKVRGEVFKNHLSTCRFRNGPIAVAATATSNCYYWKRINAGDIIPRNAFEGQLLRMNPAYIGRINMGNDGIYPTVLHFPKYTFSSVQLSKPGQQLEILIAEPGMLQWKTVINRVVPKNAIVCGRGPAQSANNVISYAGVTLNRKFIGWGRSSTNKDLTYYDNNGINRYSELQILVKSEKGLALERSLVKK